MNEMLVVGNLEFEVRRSARRKTLGLTVDRGKELVVHSPESVGEEELRGWIGKRLLWVHQKLLLKDEYDGGGGRDLEAVSGESIAYLGRNYRLRIVKAQTVPLRLDGEWFLLRENDKGEAAGLFQKWYQKVGGEWLKERVRFWEPRVGKAASRTVVRELGFRWGSCGKNAVLYFNWRLLQLPVFLVDYVVAHELTHLHEPNHSPAFWRALERALPDWQARRDALDHRNAEMRWRGDAQQQGTAR